MGPKSSSPIPQDDLFKLRLDNLIDLRHPLAILAGKVDWDQFERDWGALFESTQGRPALPTRLVAGLHYLKHAEGLSDEAVVARWVENPYWQFFCGEIYFQHQLPCDPSALSYWRKRIGEAGVEQLLAETIAAGLRMTVITASSLEQVVVDTTVQEKAVTYPTDAKLLNRAREHVVAAAQDAGLVLRQSYARVGPAQVLQVGRYAHAKQFQRMRKGVKKLKTWLGRVVRDVERQPAQTAQTSARLTTSLTHAKRLLAQKPTDKNKLYSLHAPEVECIAKGKARQRYEFGVKIGIAVTAKESFVVGARSFPGNPYDGHTLESQLEQVEILTGVRPQRVFADRGYRGAEVPPGTSLYLSGQKRLTPTLKRWLKRRNSVEPVIGHLKEDGLMRRNWLKGSMGDALHAVLCGAGHNIRILLRKIRLFCPEIWAWLCRNLEAELRLWGLYLEVISSEASNIPGNP